MVSAGGAPLRQSSQSRGRWNICPITAGLMLRCSCLRLLPLPAYEANDNAAGEKPYRVGQRSLLRRLTALAPRHDHGAGLVVHRDWSHHRNTKPRDRGRDEDITAVGL